MAGLVLLEGRGTGQALAQTLGRCLNQNKKKEK